ncbi:MAG: GntR family transcriptional regulator [Aerococcus sp.]|nr:GntR family transcriptional regulator [Aerococcus sp.]
MDFDKHRPIYAQVIEQIKLGMTDGTYQPGESLPSRREIARQLGINPNTVQRAFATLEAEGYITTEKTTVSVVTTDKEKLLILKKNLLNTAIDQLIETATQMTITESEVLLLVEAAYQRRQQHD